MIGALDIIVFRYLNGFAGRLLALDATIVLVASFLPVIAGLAYLAFLGFRFYRRMRRLPGRIAQFDVEGVAAVAALLSASAAHFLVAGFQELVARPRPYLTLHSTHLFSVGTWSFPSGHAAIFFALAAAAHRFDRKAGALLYLCATAIALARVAAGVHYPTDVFAGAMLGIIAGAIISRTIEALARVEIRRIRRSARLSVR